MDLWQNAFPKTLEALDKQGLSSYVQGFEFELKSLNLSADLRWFPVFLKMQNCPRRLLELAEFEYLRAQVYQFDYGPIKLDVNLVGLNPHAQFIEVNEDLPELGRAPGLYCLVKAGARFFEMELSLPQALILDLLKEDRKYSIDQLIDMAVIHQVKLGLSKEAWMSTISSLIERGVILKGEPTSPFKNFA